MVAATGTDKTVIAAFDFKRSFDRPHQARFLFVAHREEILVQSRGVFRNILRDHNFGELWVGNHRPEHLEQLFVSVQTLNARKLWDQVPPDFFDYIVVDEFHHGAAPSYQRLLDYFRPKILMGLTATPERADGKNILVWFHHRICSEIRLPDAINQKLLSPFQYFCISDCVDYSQLKWQRGGYDRNELEKLLITGDDIRARLIIEKAKEILLDIFSVRGICFCVSQDHAQYMAGKFHVAGIPAMALTANTARDVRKAAVMRLRHREVNFLCMVDLFNEGVDIPEIDTVMFLRPTESLEAFNDPDEQVLSKGLRRFCHHNDPGQLGQLLSMLKGDLGEASLDTMEPGMKQLLTLFCFSIWSNTPPEKTLFSNLSRLKSNGMLMAEVCALMTEKIQTFGFLRTPLCLV